MTVDELLVALKKAQPEDIVTVPAWVGVDPSFHATVDGVEFHCGYITIKTTKVTKGDPIASFDNKPCRHKDRPIISWQDKRRDETWGN